MRSFTLAHSNVGAVSRPKVAEESRSSCSCVGQLYGSCRVMAMPSPSFRPTARAQRDRADSESGVSRRRLAAFPGLVSRRACEGGHWASEGIDGVDDRFVPPPAQMQELGRARCAAAWDLSPRCFRARHPESVEFFSLEQSEQTMLWISRTSQSACLMISRPKGFLHTQEEEAEGR